MKGDKKKHPMFGRCKPLTSVQKKGCSKKYNESFTNKRKKEIHNYYWSLNKDKQNIWISHMVQTITSIRPKRKQQRKGREGKQEWRITSEKI